MHQSTPLDSFRRVTSLATKRKLKPSLISSMHLTRVVPSLQTLNLYDYMMDCLLLGFCRSENRNCTPQGLRKPIHSCSRRTLETQQEADDAKPLPHSLRNPSHHFGHTTHIIIIINHNWTARPRTLYASMPGLDQGPGAPEEHSPGPGQYIHAHTSKSCNRRGS